jgi:phenylpropionate dioxygenase-like ring-hydroxylating dioxygenase large terminal subunit
VAWSAEVAPGGVVPLRYFDADLVAYRTEAGEVHVLDAHCPHLGAHLGYGGQVDGDDVVCPFHGWAWSPEGRNTCIPYGTTVNRKLTIGPWATAEADDMILVWFDAAGRPPAWAPPTVAGLVPGFVADDFVPAYPAGIEVWRDLAVFPQFVAENIVDAAHFRFVHSARSVSSITSYETDGPTFTVRHEFDSRRSVRLTMSASGVGYLVGEFTRDGMPSHVEVQCSTPVSADTSDLRGSVWVHKSLAEDPVATDALIRIQHEELGRDIPIWEHLHYVEHAPLVGMESKPYRALRKWAAQFYVDPAPAAGGQVVGVRAGRAGYRD